MKLTPAQKRTITRATNIIQEQLAQYDVNVALSSSAIVKRFITMRIGASEHEQFLVLFLNSQNRMIADEVMFNGTVNAASVYPREVAKRALELNAVSVIIAHNHPSGAAYPSESDKVLTRSLKAALGLLDITILDHIIVGADTYSFAENRIL